MSDAAGTWMTTWPRARRAALGSPAPTATRRRTRSSARSATCNTKTPTVQPTTQPERDSHGDLNPNHRVEEQLLAEVPDVESRPHPASPGSGTAPGRIPVGIAAARGGQPVAGGGLDVRPLRPVGHAGRVLGELRNVPGLRPDPQRRR